MWGLPAFSGGTCSMEARPFLAVASSLENSKRHMGHNVLPACHSESRVFCFRMWRFPGAPVTRRLGEGIVHVPLAHQSALAGVLLAAAGLRMGLSGRVDSVVTQYDVLKPQEWFQVFPAAKHAGERCICQDADYRDVYRRKYR